MISSILRPANLFPGTVNFNANAVDAYCNALKTLWSHSILFNPISNGCCYYCKVYVMTLMIQIWWCQDLEFVRWWMSCSATTLVSSSWKAKIVFLGPGMCLQWKTTSPILAWHYSQPNWYEPEALAIWWMDWKWTCCYRFYMNMSFRI